MHEHHKVASFALLLALVFAAPAISADQRQVIVNGERVSIQQAYHLDRMAGGYFPDGRYWVDFKHGIWGVEGDPNPAGFLGPPTAAGFGYGFQQGQIYQTPPVPPAYGGFYDPGYSDDYYQGYQPPTGYGNPTGPGYNRETPGGDLMHDGNCGYVAGVPVGGCP